MMEPSIHLALGRDLEDLIELNHDNDDLVTYLAECCVCGAIAASITMRRWLHTATRCVAKNYSSGSQDPSTRFIWKDCVAGTLPVTAQGRRYKFAYSELFQDLVRPCWLLESLPKRRHGGATSSIRRSHDNDRLAKKGRTVFLYRCELSASIDGPGNLRVNGWRPKNPFT